MELISVIKQSIVLQSSNPPLPPPSSLLGVAVVVAVFKIGDTTCTLYLLQYGLFQIEFFHLMCHVEKSTWYIF